MVRNEVICCLLMTALIAYPSLTMAFSRSKPEPSILKDSQDTLRIEGVFPGEKLDIVVMIDARKRTGSGTAVCRDGSINDGPQWVERFTGISPLVIPLDNLLAPDECNSEVAVFSENHKMYVKAVKWKDSPGDVHTVKLKRRIKVPVSVWTANDADEKQARWDMGTADYLFVKNRVGIEFNPKFNRAPPEIVTLIAAKRCGAVAQIKKQGKWYTLGRLNVYYVDVRGEGRNCALEKTPGKCKESEDQTMYPKLDGNFTIIGTITAPFTLAHELGHAFGLRPTPCHGHVEGLKPFSYENIMYGGTFRADERKVFTLGQVFRINTHQDRWGGTMLITNRLRPKEDRRECRPDWWTDKCPRLDTNR